MYMSACHEQLGRPGFLVSSDVIEHSRMHAGVVSGKV